MAEPRLSLPVTPARSTASRGKPRPPPATPPPARRQPSRSLPESEKMVSHALPGVRAYPGAFAQAFGAAEENSLQHLGQYALVAARQQRSVTGGRAVSAGVKGEHMSHVAQGSGQGVPGGDTRPGTVSRGDRGLGATARRAGRQSWVEWRRAVEGETGGIAVPELAAFAGAKRTQLAALAKSTEPLREVLGEVTRVASMRPQMFGRAQTLARLRALSRPAVPWGESSRGKSEPRLTRLSVSGVPDTHRMGP